MKRLLWVFLMGFSALVAHGQISRSSFGPQVALGAGDSPIQCAVQDMDGDGRADLVIANHLNSRLTVYRNIGTGGTISASSFAAPMTFVTGSMPHDMAVGDIDGDGRMDVVTGNLGDHTISLFPNTSAPGTIRFGARIDIPAAGRLPHGVALGDVDGDQRPDLLVACHDTDSVSLFRNMGGGVSTNTFPSAAVLPIGDGPHAVAAGDLTRDGRAEILVANFQTPDLAILQHVPGPTAEAGPFRVSNFFELARLPRGGNALHIGDIDGDGQADVAVGHWRTRMLAVFRQSDPGGALLRFDAPADLSVGHSIQSVVVRDLDDDDRPDLITVGELSSYMSVFKNLASPGSIVSNSFAARVDFPSGWNANGLAVGDLERDGRPDIVFANAYDDNIFIYQNRMGDEPGEPPMFIEQPQSQTVEVGSSVTFTFGVTGTEPFTFRWRKNGVSIPNSDTDTFTIHNVQPSDAGVYTVVAMNPVNPSPGVISAPATLTVTGTNALPPTIMRQPQSQTVEAGANVTFSVEAIGTEPLTYRWRRNGIYLPDAIGPVLTLNSVTPAQGGFYSVIVSNIAGVRISVNALLRVLTPTNPPPATFALAAPMTFGAGDSPVACAYTDLDNDDKPDLLVVNHLSSTLSAYRNQSAPGAIGFAPPVTFATGLAPVAMAVGDLFGTGGGLDVVTANWSNNTISVFVNRSTTNISFHSPMHIPIAPAQGPRAVAISDVNGDGASDVVVAAHESDSLVILPGRTQVGALPFGPPFIIPNVGDGPHAVTLNDIDADGGLDIVVANFQTPELTVFRRNRAIAPTNILHSALWDPPQRFPRGGVDVIARDVDGDSRLDILVGNWRAHVLSVFRNRDVAGTIALDAPVDLNTGNNFHHVDTGDLDADGKPELVAVGEGPSFMSIFKNLSTPGTLTRASFAGRTDFPSGWNPHGVVVADIDDDNRQDITFANAYDDTITIYRNTHGETNVIQPPRFVVQPQSQTVPVGSTAIFHVEVEGTPPFGYRWRRNGANVIGFGQGTDTLIISNVQPAHAGVYSVVVTNAANPAPGVLSSNAVLVVVETNAPPLPLIGMNHRWRYDQSGSDLSASFMAREFDDSAWLEGAAPLGVEFAPLPAPINTALTLGQVTYYFRTDLDLTAAQLNSISQFYLQTMIDDGAIVYVNGAEVLRLRMPEGPVTGSTFAQTVVGDAMMEGPFYIPADQFVAGENVIAVEVHQVNFASSDIVFGMTLNAVGGVNTNLPPPMITEQPQSQTVAAGGTAMFHVEATGAGPLAYRWRRNGVTIPDANTHTLTLANVQLSDAGVYTVVVSNVGSPAPGVISAPATLTVIGEPPPPPGDAPVITRIHPTSGPVGTELAIEGTALTNGTTHVRVGGVLASVVSANATQLVVRVPLGAMHAPVTVTANGRTAYSRERFNVTFTAAERIRSAYFGPRVDLPCGPIPIHMAGGDIDGDGYTDLVVANRDGANFTVFRNRGPAASGFHAGVHFPAGNTPYQLAIADMNGDGRLDVVTADAHSNTASVHRNTSSPGSLSFAARVASPVGRRPISIAVGDLNRDGFLDVVTGDYDDHAVSVLLGADGTGALLPRVTYPTGGDTHALAVADVTGDGYADVVGANYLSGSVALLRGTAAGTLAPRQLFAGGGNTITLADVDFDNDLDLVVGNYRGSEVRIFPNVGFHTAEQFFSPLTFAAGTTPHQVAIGDLNGDGSPDVAAAGEYPSRIGVLQNVSGWSAGIIFSPPELLVAQANETGIVLADFDLDGRPDVAVANAYSSTISWFHNNIPETEPPFEPPRIIRQPQSQSVPWEGTAVFSVEATGTPPLGYLWRHNNVMVPNSNTNRLVLANVQPSDAGNYWVQITNAAGSAVSETVTLTVTGTNQVPPGNLVALGHVWRYEASGTDLGTAWRDPNANDDAWPSGPALLGFESGPLPAPIQTTLPIGPITYYFRTEVNLNVPIIDPFAQFRLRTLVDDGAVVYINGMEAVRVGMPVGEITYNTLATRSAEAIFEGPFVIPPRFFVPGRNVIAVEVHQGQVASGDVVFGLTLEGQPGGTNNLPLRITQQPQSQTVPAGGTVTFEVQAVGTGPLRYQWFKDGAQLGGATNRVLTLTDVQASDSGVYMVSLTDAVATIMSQPATLTVGPSVPAPQPPVITSFTPQSGPTSTVVTINGRNFAAAVGVNRVYFGAVRARVLTASTTELTVQVPIGATYEPISVNTSNRVAFSDLPFVVTFDSSRTIHRQSFSGFNLPSGDSPVHVSMGDMEGNGKVDFVVANHYSSTVGVYLNDDENDVLEAVDFGPSRTYPTGMLPFHMALADVDGVGGLDVITANPGNHTISLVRNTPAGVFALSPPVNFPVGRLPIAVVTGDLDKDGRMDIVVANHDSDSITILRQVSNPFATIATAPFQRMEVPIGDGPHNIVIGDVDGDSRAEIIVANYQTPTMAVLRNLTTGPGIGPGSFAPAVHFPRGGNCLAYGDLDGDGKGDIAIGNWRTQTLSLFRNVSSRGAIGLDSLAAPVDFAMGNNPHTIALSDLDGDARVDIALVGELPSYMSIFRNVSTAGSLSRSSFESRVDFPSGWNAIGVAAGDLDRDGRPELVFANAYDDNLTVYRNQTDEQAPNEPPIARATAGPAVGFLSDGDRYVVIDPLREGAMVCLDGSASHDPDGDDLTFEWSINGEVAGTEESISRRLSLGTHVVSLRVSDGIESDTTTITVEVIMPADAVGGLIELIGASDLPPRVKQRVIAILEDTISIIVHDLRRADTRLERAQRRIRLLLGREDPELANLIIEALEQIIHCSRCD